MSPSSEVLPHGLLPRLEDSGTYCWSLESPKAPGMRAWLCRLGDTGGLVPCLELASSRVFQELQALSLTTASKGVDIVIGGSPWASGCCEPEDWAQHQCTTPKS